jgi:hypothetical protein
MRGAARIAVINQLLGATNTTGNNSHSYGNIDVGALANVKHAIFVVQGRRDSNYSVNSFTVGGVGLAQRIQQNSGGTPDINSFIFAGDISSLDGSQAIVCNFSNGVNSSACSGVIVTGMESPVPVDTAQAAVGGGGTNPLTLVGLSAPANGIVLAGIGGSTGTEEVSWESLIERADVATGSGHNLRHSAAWSLGLRLSADEDVTLVGNNKSVVAASFR